MRESIERTIGSDRLALIDAKYAQRKKRDEVWGGSAKQRHLLDLVLIAAWQNAGSPLQQTGHVVSVTVATRGAGYATKDEVTLPGVGEGDAVIVVDTVDERGGIDAVRVARRGTYTAALPDTVAAVGGQGSGAVFSVVSRPPDPLDFPTFVSQSEGPQSELAAWGVWLRDLKRLADKGSTEVPALPRVPAWFKWTPPVAALARDAGYTYPTE